MNNKRAQERAEFLNAAGWSAADATALTGDASTRSYERLNLGARKAILMNAPLASEGASCPPTATPAERRGIGYNALARLAGPNLDTFVTIARTLNGAGLSAPEIYHADSSTGFALIEDLGDNLFARVIPDGASENTLYNAAIDALVHLRKQAPLARLREHYPILDYDTTAMAAEVILVTEWYWPYLKNETAPETLQHELSAIWSSLFLELPKPSILVLRDFHAENLLWLPDRKSPKNAGIIDFQDALVGHAGYDLVSLLEDARRDVNPTTPDAMINRYIAGIREFTELNEELFRHEYAILGAQRNAKILGIFARLVNRDNKARYADLLPRVEGHFRNNLKHPAMKTLAEFFHKHFPDRF